jgi:hypothetical protein
MSGDRLPVFVWVPRARFHPDRDHCPHDRISLPENRYRCGLTASPVPRENGKLESEEFTPS